jgi:hypothetical protein
MNLGLSDAKIGKHFISQNCNCHSSVILKQAPLLCANVFDLREKRQNLSGLWPGLVPRET